MRFPLTSPVVQSKKNPPATQETGVQSLSLEDPLEKGLATHSSIPALEISGTEEPGRLQSTGSHELDSAERQNHHPLF